MTYVLTPAPKIQVIDDNGDPVSGGKVNTYAAGTSTPVATYTSSAGTTPNANPVILDSSGRATIYLLAGTNYKFVVTDADDNLIYSQDNILSEEIPDAMAIGNPVIDSTGPAILYVDDNGDLAQAEDYYFDNLAGHLALLDADDHQLFNYIWDAGSGSANYTYKPNTAGGYLGIVGASPAAECSVFAWNSSTSNGSVAGFFAAHHAAAGGLSYLDLFRYDTFGTFLRGWRASMQSARGDDLRFSTVASDGTPTDRVAFTRDGAIGLIPVAEADAVAGWHVFYVDIVDDLLRRKDPDGIITNLQPAAPITVTDASYSVVVEATSIIANRAGTVTLTLPTASVFPGRILNVRTIQAQSVVSNASNVVPLIGGSAGTAILPATDGAWAMLQSDGTNWLISEEAGTGGGGGGMAIGGAVTSGTASCILYVDSGPVLAQDAGFKWDAADNVIVIASSGNDLKIGLTPQVDFSFAYDSFTNDAGSNGNNIGIGKQVFQGALAGEENIAIGTASLSAATSANEVVAMGRFSGVTVTTADGCTFVGSYADGTATDSNQNSFGFEAACTATNQVTLGNASIATLRCQQTSITALSDERDKTDIEDNPYGLDFINSLRSVIFTWNARDGSQVGVKDCNFISQELKTVDNDYLRLVYDVNPDRLEATPGRLIPVLVKAIQELAARVRELEAK